MLSHLDSPLPSRPSATGATAATPPFVGKIAPLSAKQRALMTGVSWRPGCPVPLADLRLLTVSHWGFDGRRRTGRLVVHETAASSLRRCSGGCTRPGSRAEAWCPSTPTAGATSARSRPTTRRRSTAAARRARAAGRSTRTAARSTSTRSRTRTSRTGACTTTRAAHTSPGSPARKGMAVEGKALVRTFDAIGWGWGGRWTGSVKDYQHFSASGR